MDLVLMLRVGSEVFLVFSIKVKMCMIVKIVKWFWVSLIFEFFILI